MDIACFSRCGEKRQKRKIRSIMDKRNTELLRTITSYLKSYDGPELRIMEVCGSHTGAIAKYGIPQLLSDRIHIDRMIELSLQPDVIVTTFGDLLRVPGSRESLSEAKGRGAKARMVYSPFDTIDLAKKDPAHTYVFAALGFETTAPVYALMARQVLEDGIPNVKLLTAIKTMPAVIRALMDSGAPVNAFLAPGHVSVVTGSRIWEPLAEQYEIPFAVAGFQGIEILEALYGIARWTNERLGGRVMNFYPSVVSRAAVSAVWRGIGEIEGSGLALRGPYAALDAGSRGLSRDVRKNKACRCGEVLCGKIPPTACPLHGKVCTPLTPQGACMVSPEGSCRTWFEGGRKR